MFLRWTDPPSPQALSPRRGELPLGHNGAISNWKWYYAPATQHREERSELPLIQHYLLPKAQPPATASRR